jgi:hypothetical protein
MWGKKTCYSQTGHRWQYNTAHAHCSWINKATDTHLETVVSTYWFCTAAMVTWRRFIFTIFRCYTLYTHCLSCCVHPQSVAKFRDVVSDWSRTVCDCSIIHYTEVTLPRGKAYSYLVLISGVTGIISHHYLCLHGVQRDTLYSEIRYSFLKASSNINCYVKR